ncbi:MAG TPA: hypothetical protein VGQ18_01515 [Gemmatimonadales bacterium]|nr:hypothetical protein [Gemmatimonadales bacterium]
MWTPFHEPLRVTLLRTVLIALVAGVVVGRSALWLPWTAFALWLSFGGHWVEIFFLNWLRPRLPEARWAQISGRLLIWIVGGTVLMIGARATALSLGIPALRVPPWTLGGPIFICVELFVHALSQVRAQPNFFNGAS